MSYQVLARKWRPRSFGSLIGQEHVVKALANGLEHKRLHHAYLFTGTRGVGKTTLARILAKALNCETGITASPCGRCTACTEIDAGRFVDLLEVDAATNTRVDEMRQLLDNAVYMPSRGRFKVYVIDEVHMLSTSAFNAMLKTLEEPPEHIKFILATTDPQKIPVTVLSRCLQFNLKQMPAAAITTHLGHILGEEGIAGEEGALRLLAAAARGSMRDALSLLDQAIAYSGGSVSEASVRAMLGSVDRGYLYEIADAVARGDAQALLEVAGRMDAHSISFDAALQDLATLYHTLALAAAVPGSVAGEDPDKPRVLALASRFDPEELQLHYQIAIHARQDLPHAPDAYAGFTMALLRMVAFTAADREGSAGPDRNSAGHAGKSGVAANRATEQPAARSGAQPTAGASARLAQAAEMQAAAGGAGDAIDWPETVRSLNLIGVARQLAQRSALVGYANGVIELSIAASFRHLAEAPYQEKLRAALEEFLGRKLRLKVHIGETAGGSVQDRAVEAITGDAFVRGLMEQFDATIVDSSIKPTVPGRP